MQGEVTRAVVCRLMVEIYSRFTAEAVGGWSAKREPSSMCSLVCVVNHRHSDLEALMREFSGRRSGMMLL